MTSRREWLTDLRINKSLTQKEVASRAGINRSTYALIESGKRSPSVSAAKGIAEALEFDWANFFGEKCGNKQLNIEKSNAIHVEKDGMSSDTRAG